MRGRTRLMLMLGIVSLTVILCAAWLGRRYVAAWYYKTCLDSADAGRRGAAASALADLGMAWTAPLLAARVEGKGDCATLSVVFSKVKQGAQLARDSSDPCASAVIRLGKDGARELMRTLGAMKGCEKGWAVLLGAEAGLEGIETETLAQVATAPAEEEIVRRLACVALETMGREGAIALGWVEEALQEDDDTHGVLDLWARKGGRVHTEALCAAFRAGLRWGPETNMDTPALCRALEMPERILKEWPYKVRFAASLAGEKQKRVLVLTANPEAMSWAPIAVATDREFEVHWWKRLDELDGYFLSGAEIAKDSSSIRIGALKSRGANEIVVEIPIGS